jgi:tetratricopeptide (TPR) repeat protein
VPRLTVRFTAGDASTPYAALQRPLRDLAGIPPDAAPAQAGPALAAWAAGLGYGRAEWLPLAALPFGAALRPSPEVDALAPAFRRARLHEAVTDLLALALGSPTLFVLEDVHWADEATVALFTAVAASDTGTGRVICALRRPGPEPFSDGVTARLDLGSLPAEAVAQLALNAAGQAPLSDATLGAIVDRAAGNPLFARELAAAAGEGRPAADLPDRLETLLASRIDRLDPVARALLRRVSVIGRTVELDLLGEIAGPDVGDVRDLALWASLDEFIDWVDAGTVRFRHDLLRDAAYAGLSHARRRELHGHAADAIERRAGDSTDAVAAALALHHELGGHPALAFHYARRAGDLARAQYANVDAAELYERALAAGAHVETLATAELAGVAESLGDVAELAGRYEEARRAYARARALARRAGQETTGDRLRAARVARKSGIVCERAGRYVEALSWYTRGLASLPAGSADGSDALRIRLTLDVAGIRMRQGKYSACVRTALPAAAMAERTGERALLAHAYYLLHAAYGDLGSPEVARYRHLALPIYEELGDLVGQGNVLNNLGIEAYFEGRWDVALDLYRRSKEAKSRAGDVANAATQSNNEAEILSDQGRYEDAEALLRDALRVWSAAGYEIGVALATSNLGRAAARAGRHDDGLAMLRDAASRFERIGAHGYVDETRARIAECLAFAGAVDAAHDEAVATLERVRREAETSVLGAQLERVLAWAAAARGDLVAARAHVASSVRQARALGAEFELALTGRAAAAAGLDPDESWPTPAEIDAIVERLGVRSVPGFLAGVSRRGEQAGATLADAVGIGKR